GRIANLIFPSERSAESTACNLLPRVNAWILCCAQNDKPKQGPLIFITRISTRLFAAAGRERTVVATGMSASVLGLLRGGGPSGRLFPDYPNVRERGLTES